MIRITKFLFPSLPLSVVVLLFPLVSVRIWAQAAPTAKRGAIGDVFTGPLSVFGTVGKTDLGFGGQNTAVTGGANFRFRGLFGVQPAIEFRATLPIRSGHIAGEENFLYGPVLRASFHALHPYVNYLVGRGALNYQSGGYLDAYGVNLYTKSFSAIHSPGIGVDVDLTRNWAVKADAQYQLWSSIPVIATGETRSISVTIGAQYRIHMPDHRHASKTLDTNDGTWTPLHKRYPGSTGTTPGTGSTDGNR